MITISQEVVSIRHYDVSAEDFVNNYLVEIHLYKEEGEYDFYVRSNSRGNIYRVFSIPVDFFNDSTYDLIDFESGKHYNKDLGDYLINKLDQYFKED